MCYQSTKPLLEYPFETICVNSKTGIVPWDTTLPHKGTLNVDTYTAGKPWKEARRQHIMEVAYQLFSEKGIGEVTMPEIAQASGVSRATLYRYFNSKLDLVVAISTWTWSAYISTNNATITPEAFEHMSGAECLKFYLDSFVDLYRNHGALLRFNYDFNSYLHHDAGTPEQRQSYIDLMGQLHASFRVIYERGQRDGTLNADISEEAMFSGMIHIMLAAATRYAVGLVYVSEETSPESELNMLAELLLSRYTRQRGAPAEEMPEAWQP